MKTLPEIIGDILSVVIGIPYYHTAPIRQVLWDVVCFVFGHNKTGMSGLDNRYFYVCNRCHRVEPKARGYEGTFYHNWELIYGKYARCHDHRANT